MERSNTLLKAGDIVKYVGPPGLYVGEHWLDLGDTGAVVRILDTEPDRTICVRLFKDSAYEIALPSPFWFKL